MVIVTKNGYHLRKARQQLKKSADSKLWPYELLPELHQMFKPSEGHLNGCEDFRCFFTSGIQC